MSISHRPLPALSSPPCQVASLFFDPFIHYLLFSPASTLLRSCTRRASLPFLLVLVPSFGARINTSHAGFFFASSRPQHLIAFHPPAAAIGLPSLPRPCRLARPPPRTCACALGTPATHPVFAWFGPQHSPPLCLPQCVSSPPFASAPCQTNLAPQIASYSL